MRLLPTALPDVRLIEPVRHADRRGFVAEPYSQRALAEAGIALTVVQTTLIRSTRRSTLRGLHVQIPPHPQARLVQVLRGAILDVAVDLRRSSPAYGRHAAVELDADAGRLLHIPAGHAHGFLTLADETDVQFLLDAPHEPSSGRGLAFDDPDLGIDWPVLDGPLVVSERDRGWPRLRDLPDWFA